MEIYKSFTFSAAHFLPHAGHGHKCSTIHGHNFKVTIYVEGKIQIPGKGWVMDFKDISNAWFQTREKLDHSMLNNIDGLENPTSEVLAIWIWDRVVKKLPKMTKIVVSETPETGCIYKGEYSDQS